MNKVLTRARQWQRQGWTLVDDSEDPPKATLKPTVSVKSYRLGSRFARERSIRHYRRTIWLDDNGELHDDKTSGPD